MKMFLPFGDWSDDGHGKYEKILIDAPSMEHLLEAQKKITQDYDRFFWQGFAEEYEDPTITEDIMDALVKTNYPVENFKKYMDDIRYEDYNTLEEAFGSDEFSEDCFVTLDFVIDAFIWLLNAYGAEITRLDELDPIPMICNWTCRGFETVGYGCFY